MFRDFYLQVANEMLDYADERIAEAKKFTEKAEYYVQMANEIESEELFSCIRKIRKEHNITAKKICKNLGLAESTVSQMLNKAKNISFAKLTKMLYGMNLDLVVFDPKGKPHVLARREYVTSFKRPFEKGHEAFAKRNSPDIFFKS